jgi:hypothetical protein
MDDGLGESSAAARLSSTFGRKLQHYLDKAAPHTTVRWVVATILTLLYAVRVYFLNGWYIVTYGLGIYLLNLLIAFLSPQVRAGAPARQTIGCLRASGRSGEGSARRTRTESAAA